ncbi:MAG: hypothetical protein IJS08_11505, partial [Victivallales bacterium]|nr:hypothetical protein [Victivallales bacterium]
MGTLTIGASTTSTINYVSDSTTHSDTNPNGAGDYWTISQVGVTADPNIGGTDDHQTTGAAVNANSSSYDSGSYASYTDVVTAAGTPAVDTAYSITKGDFDAFLAAHSGSGVTVEYSNIVLANNLTISGSTNTSLTLKTTDASITVGTGVTVTGVGNLILDTAKLAGGGDLTASGDITVQNIKEFDNVALTAGSVGSGHSLTVSGTEIGVTNPVTFTADSVSLSNFKNGTDPANLVTVETKKLTAATNDSLIVYAKGGLSDSTSSVAADVLTFSSNGNVLGTFEGTTSADIDLTGNFEGAVTSAALTLTTTGNVNMTTGSKVDALTLTQNGTTKDFALDNGTNVLTINDITGDFNNVSITAGNITTAGGDFSAAQVDISATKFDGTNMTITAPVLNVTNEAAADTHAVFYTNGSIDVINYTATNDEAALTVVNDGDVTLKVNSDVYTLNASSTGVLTLDTDVTTTNATALVLSGADGVVAKNITSKGDINITSANGDITAGILDSDTGIFYFNAKGAVEATNLTSASADTALINLADASSVSLASDRDSVTINTLPAEITGDFAFVAASSNVALAGELKAANVDITAKSFTTPENVTTTGDLAITAADGNVALNGVTKVGGVYAIDASANGAVTIADAQDVIKDGSSIAAKDAITITTTADDLAIGAATITTEGAVAIGNGTKAAASLTGAEVTTAGNVTVYAQTIADATIDPANVDIHADSVTGTTIEATAQIDITELTANNGVVVTDITVNSPIVNIDKANGVDLTSTSALDTMITVNAQATSTEPISIAQTGAGALVADITAALVEEISVSSTAEKSISVNILAPKAALTIDAAGGASMVAGSDVKSVDITATGNVVINDENALTITGVTTQGDVTATMGGAATINGAVSGKDIAITATAIDGSGEIAPTGTLTLEATAAGIEATINKNSGIAITAVGDVNITNNATGNVTVTSLESTGGSVTFAQAGEGTLTLDNGGATVVSADANITITTDGSILANDEIISNTAGNVSLTGKAGITANGEITATAGSVELNAENGAVTTTAVINAENDGADAITILAHDAINVADLNAIKGNVSVDSTDGAVSLAQVDASGDITVLAGSNTLVEYNVDITLGGAISGANVTLQADNKVNIVDNTIEATVGYVDIDGKVITSTDAAATITAATNVDVNATTGKIDLKGAVEATGNITIDSAEESVTAAALTAGGTATVKAGSNAMTNTDASVSLTGAVSATGVVVAADKDVTADKTLEATATNVEITADAGKVELKDNIIAQTNVAVKAATDATAKGTVTATDGNVNVEATAGTAAFEKAVSGKTGVTATAGTDITTTDAATLTAATGDVKLTAENGKVDLKAAVQATADANSVTVKADSVKTTDAATLKAGKDVDVTATNKIELAGAVTATTGNIKVDSAEDSVSAAALTATAGTATVKAGSNDITNTDGSVSLTGAVNATGIEIAADKDVSTAALAASTDDVAITAATGAAVLGGDVEAEKNVSITAATDVTANGAITANTEAVSIEATAGTATLNKAVEATVGDVNITAVAVTTAADGTLTAGTDVDIDATGDVTLAAKATAGQNVEIEGANVSADEIEAATDVTVEATAKATFNKAVVATAGKIDIDAVEVESVAAGTLTAETNVDVNATTGAITLLGAVTANTGDITIDSAENNVNVAGLSATAGSITLKAGSNDLTDTTAIVELAGPVTAGVNVVIAADGDFTVADALTAGDGATNGYVSVTAANLAVNANITGDGADANGNAVVLTATKGTVTVDAAA